MGWSNCRSQLGSKSGGTLFSAAAMTRIQALGLVASQSLKWMWLSSGNHGSSHKRMGTKQRQIVASLNLHELRYRDTKYLRTLVCMSANMLHWVANRESPRKRLKADKHTKRTCCCNILQEPRVVCLIASVKFWTRS